MNHVSFQFPGHKHSKAVFIVPPQVHLLDLSGPAHICYEASCYGAPLELVFAYIDNNSKTESTSGLAFSSLVHYTAIKVEENDVIFVPGFRSDLLTNDQFYDEIKPFLLWLQQQSERNITLCSVCTGAFILAAAGVLDQRECTTHWKFQSVLAAHYPQVKVMQNRLFVQDEPIYSSAGVASGIDLALYVMEKRYGTAFSVALAREVVVYLRRGIGDPQLSIFLQYRNHLEDKVHTVQDWLMHHISERVTIEELASLVSSSPRNLTRLFKRTIGITIGEYIEKLRMERAMQMLREDSKIDIVAKSCGLQSTNQLRQLFKKHVGMLPSDFRK
jgi:transcriptional regulator GlxA family with amidase domain